MSFFFFGSPVVDNVNNLNNTKSLDKISGLFAGLQLEDKIVQTAFAGDHVEVCLSNVDEVSLFTGVVLCEPDSLVPVVSRIQARIVVFNTLAIPITNVSIRLSTRKLAN